MRINHPITIPECDARAVSDFIQHLLNCAVFYQSSDIHFESQKNNMTIRFRIHGLLHTIHTSPKTVAPIIINYLKIKANLDISEKRLPQDGRFTICLQQQHTVCRVSTLPTLYGEKVVLRLLHTEAQSFTLDRLALDPDQKTLFLNSIHKPQGFILITGPTGSGKTTTLYTALSLLNTHDKNITTIEDPIEIELEHINQLAIHPKIGLNFQQALRALLRQDPDIIMVGEIRDLETAQMAIHAAQTGHLVFSTLHTNNAVETMTRLTLMGISILDLVETLTLIMAQRLVRTLCTQCKRPIILPTEVLQKSGLSPQANHTLFQPTGCPQCTQGFNGRIGVYQFFEPTETIKTLLLQGYSPSQLLRHHPIATLWEKGLCKVTAGLTSLTELYRTIESPQSES